MSVECFRMYQLSVRDLLTFVTALPVSIGVVAAVESTANKLSDNWFGTAWYGDVRRFLIYKLSLPSDFVTGYVSHALIDLPAWTCYAALALILGLIRPQWSSTIGLAFVMSILAWDLLSDTFYGLHARINLRLESLFGAVLVSTFYAVARRFRRRVHITDNRPRRLEMSLMYFALAATFAISIYGWWLVDASRKEGHELTPPAW